MKPAKRATNGAVGYCRVSTVGQVEGLSLEAQEGPIRAYCEMRGLELGEVVVDGGVSASEPLDERSGGRQVKDAIAKGAPSR